MDSSYDRDTFPLCFWGEDRAGVGVIGSHQWSLISFSLVSIDPSQWFKPCTWSWSWTVFAFLRWWYDQMRIIIRILSLIWCFISCHLSNTVLLICTNSGGSSVTFPDFDIWEMEQFSRAPSADCEHCLGTLQSDKWGNKILPRVLKAAEL